MVARVPSYAVPQVAVRLPLGKRAFDVAVSSVALLLLAPLFVAVWLAVRLTSPGGALFRQNRVGRYGRPFVMYKFRSMVVDCPDDLHRAYVKQLLTADEPQTGGTSGLYKLEGDPRVTRVGRLLRRTSLDELPQLLNVLRGDMSLVGPRPALPWEAELFGPAHVRRFLVPPGVTGLWQVSGRNRLSMRDGLDLDLEYVRRLSFRLDLAILVRTVPAVLSLDGAR
jgi:lipopolysaccharide/colanic/teichoic acid biosynthesis glycosyltransferase